MSIKIPSDIEHILEAGNSAPSGENCQPWHFVVRGNKIEVHLLPERDQSAYSWGQRTSYLANGAVIENIVIAASANQYRAEVQYFPNSVDQWHTATIVLIKDASVISDALAPFVSKRISNRKLYKKEPLTSKERQALFSAVKDEDYGEIVLTEDPREMRRLGRVGSTNEEVMLANHSLHQFFFSHVNWTKEEDEKKKIGFYIKTLELPPPVEFMFKIFQHWPIMRVLSAIGFTRVVGMQNGVTNASASAIGAITMSGTEPLDFVKIGRTIERVWVTTASLGLSFQPVAGLLFFKLRIDEGEDAIFSLHQKKLIMDAYKEASRVLDVDEKHIAFMFRVGHGEPASAHAVRFPLRDVITVIS